MGHETGKENGRRNYTAARSIFPPKPDLMKLV